MKIWPFKAKAVNTSVPITASVWRKLEKVFPPDTRKQASLLLQHKCARNLPLMHSLEPEAYDRIRFAVLKLSKGRLDTLEEMIREAQVDWRDVLLGAGFGYDCQIHLQWNPETDESGVGADRAENVARPDVAEDARSAER